MTKTTVYAMNSHQTSIIPIGLDVDDAQYHGSALDKNSAEIITCQCRLTLKGLLNELKNSTNIFQIAL